MHERSLVLSTLLVSALGVHGTAAASTFITATPKDLSVAIGQLGTTQICWGSSADAYVYVSNPGQTPTLFGSSGPGQTCQAAAWIMPRNTYIFQVFGNLLPADLNAAPPPLASVTVRAAPHWITADPAHVALSAGQSATATISWGTEGLATAQVWKFDGVNETLVGQSAAGSQSVQIAPTARHVFKLYAGTAHQQLLAWTSVSARNARNGESVFGFNYWPEGYASNVLENANWAPVKATVSSDLSQMASLSAGVIRLMLWPEWSGFNLGTAPTLTDQNGALTSLGQQVTNLVEMLQLCEQRGLKVILVFADYNAAGNWVNTPSYASDYTAYLAHTAIWMQAWISAVESSPHKETVVYYDIAHEWSSDWARANEYLVATYDNSGAPLGKRGASVLHMAPSVAAPDDSSSLVLALGWDSNGITRRVDYVDFHSYPEDATWGSVNGNIEVGFDRLKSLFPDSTAVLGEFGRHATNPAQEGDQTRVVGDFINRARQKGFAYYLNWLVWDHSFTGASPTAWAYDRNSPKDAWGKASEMLTLLSNPDFEALAGGLPESWSAGGTVTATLSAGCNVWDNPGTNRCHARVTANAAGTVWLVSYLAPVNGGRKVFANAFVRSNMNAIALGITEYAFDQGTSTWVQVQQTSGPVLAPGEWAWRNYLGQVGAFDVTLNASTRRVILSITGSTNAAPGYLDVDTVSLWEQP